MGLLGGAGQCDHSTAPDRIRANPISSRKHETCSIFRTSCLGQKARNSQWETFLTYIIRNSPLSRSFRSESSGKSGWLRVPNSIWPPSLSTLIEYGELQRFLATRCVFVSLKRHTKSLVQHLPGHSLVLCFLAQTIIWRAVTCSYGLRMLSTRDTSLLSFPTYKRNISKLNVASMPAANCHFWGK